MIDIPSVGQGLKATSSQFSEAEILSFRHFRPRHVPFGILLCWPGAPAKAYTTGQAGAVVERLSISAEQNCVSGE